MAPAPPPLKKAKASDKPPKRRPVDDGPPHKGGRQDTADLLAAAMAAQQDAELSSPALAAIPDDDDPTKGEWLFKQNDMVLGPVTAMVLVDRIKQGELSADTPIARDGQAFKPMKLVALFREAYEVTLEKKRREDEEREYNKQVGRARAARAFIVLVLLSVPAGAAAFAGHTVMKLQPWDKTAEWIAKAPPLVDLPPRPIEVKKDEPKPVAVADNTEPAASEDDGKPDRPGTPRKRPSGDRGGKDPKDGKDAKQPEEVKQTGPLPETLTNAQAVAPLNEAKGDLKACFKAELDSNPDVPSPVVLSYTVTEDGKAANVNLDNRELRGRPVVECVRKALAGVRWPRFTGERKNVSVPFKLSKPPKPGEPPK